MEQNSDRIFFEFLAKAYQSFLSGEDTDSVALEEELASSFGVCCASLEVFMLL